MSNGVRVSVNVKKKEDVLTCIPYIHSSNSCKGEEATWLFRKKDVLLCR